MAKKPAADSLLINNLLDPKGAKKWTEFLNKAQVKGSSFSDGEVQRALNAGYTLDDVNDYLKWSGITPSGSFGVGGFNKQTKGAGSGDGLKETVVDTPYYRYFGNATAQPQQPAAAPEAAPAPTPEPTPNPQTAPGNPALSIPGVDVRLTGENLGIKARNSNARRSGQINKGTSRLTIPRSSGANSLNIG